MGVAETKPETEPTVDVDVGRENAICVNVAVGKTVSPFPPCPPPEGGGLGVFVQTGGTGVSVGIAVSEGVTPGGRVWLGVLVEVGEGVSESNGVTPGTSVSVAVGVVVSVSVGEGVIVPVGENVSVGIGVNVFVETGGGGEL